MNSKVRVSIIMPSLNVCDYISDSLFSVMNQTLSDIEIICIDAGSTDGTWEIIQEAAKQDSRITAIQSPVTSYGFQVNMGISMANGEYFGILETDDYVSENMYELLYQKALETGTSEVKCDYATYTTDCNGNKHFIERKVSQNETFYESAFTPADYPNVVDDDWYLWNGIYKTSFIKDNSIKFSETLGAAFQDIGFLHRVATLAETCIFIHQSLYRYCVDRADASSNSNKALRYIRKEYGILIDEIEESTDFKNKRLLYIRMVSSYIRSCMYSNDNVLSEKESVEICSWFQRKLREAERWGYLNEKDIPKGLMGGYHHLIRPTEGFMSYRRYRQEELKSFLDKGENIVIFGCGMFGREAKKYVQKLGFTVKAFLDNDSSLWESQIEDINIYSPMEYICDNDDNYLVANEKYADEIVRQINEQNKDAHIFVFSPELLYSMEMV